MLPSRPISDSSAACWADCLSFDFTIGGDDQNAGLLQLPGEKAQQQQRVFVGRVQIVEHHHQRGAPGKPLEETCDGVKKTETFRPGSPRCVGKRQRGRRLVQPAQEERSVERNSGTICAIWVSPGFTSASIRSDHGSRPRGSRGSVESTARRPERRPPPSNVPTGHAPHWRRRSGRSLRRAASCRCLALPPA